LSNKLDEFDRINCGIFEYHFVQIAFSLEDVEWFWSIIDEDFNDLNTLHCLNNCFEFFTNQDLSGSLSNIESKIVVVFLLHGFDGSGDLLDDLDTVNNDVFADVNYGGLWVTEVGSHLGQFG